MKTPKHLNIDVQQRDIDGGSRQNCALCPIALAFQRRTGADLVYVDFDRIFITDDGFRPALGARIYAVSGDVEEFMNDFDAGRTVTPFRPVLVAAL